MKLPLLPNGAALRLQHADGVLGGVIWPSASVLCKHLLDEYHVPNPTPSTRSNQKKISSMNVLELGSGTGAVGLFAAGMGVFSSVHLTDHRPPMAAAMTSVPYQVDGSLDIELTSPEDSGNPAKSDTLLRLLENNVNDNQEHLLDCPPQIHELDWTRPKHAEKILQATGHPCGFELLLASDVTYNSQLHGALARTMAALLMQETNDPNQVVPKCLVAHELRVVNIFGIDTQLEGFQQAVQTAGLSVVGKHESSSLVDGLKVCILEIGRGPSVITSKPFW